MNNVPSFGHRHPDDTGKVVTEASTAGNATSNTAAVSEPSISDATTELVQDHMSRDSATPDELVRLRLACLTRMDATAVATLPPARLLAEVESLISDLATEQHVQMNGREQRKMAGELVDDMLGLGPLEPLLLDDSINDIMVNGPKHTFIERAGQLSEVAAHFRDVEHLTNVCQRIAASIGRHVDESSPMVDARLKDGSRVNIVLPPLALNGPLLSIRKFSKKPMDFNMLIGHGSLTASLAKILEICARSRLNVIISGGTGSGKTTMMNAMSRFINPRERIITVEDVAELQLQQPHVAQMETRPPSLEGKGEVTTRDLVRNALRMRPDRIIVGEVRGAEAFDMLQAMNTGHDGSMSTVHANSARDTLSRIENMVQMSAMGLTSQAIKMELTAAVNIIVHLDRHRDGVRRVTQVTEIAGMEGEAILLHDIFKFELIGEGPSGTLFGKYEISRIKPSFSEQLRYFDLEHAWVEAMEQAASDSAVLDATSS